MPFCTRCGAQMYAEDKFCMKCGCPVAGQIKNPDRASGASMKAIVCEMCNGRNLVKNGGYYVCQNCGTKYSIEEAKKLIVELGGTVKVDRTSELNNLYQLARRARQTQNANDAYQNYCRIASIDPQSWEAFFYSVYYQSVLTYQNNIISATQPLANSIVPALNMIKARVSNPNDISIIINQMSTDLFKHANNCAGILFDQIQQGRRQLQDSRGVNPGRGLQVWSSECDRLLAIADSVYGILYVYGDGLLSVLGDEYRLFAVEAWKTNVNSHAETISYLVKNEPQMNKIIGYCDKIRQYEPSFKTPQQAIQATKKGGCYVATAVYGSYDCPQVWTLRRYRDNTLASTWYGRLFIHTYYAISPSIVKWFGDTDWFKIIWRRRLDKMVSSLNSQGVEDTPYNDKEW